MFELQQGTQNAEEDDEVNDESTNLKTALEKLNEIRAMQIDIATKAAEIAGNKKRKMDLSDTTAVKKLQNYYDQLFPLAVQEFFYATNAQKIVLDMVLEKHKTMPQLAEGSNANAGGDHDEIIEFPPDETETLSGSSRRKIKHEMWDVANRENPLEAGVEVAALIDENSEPNLWILAYVQRYEASRKRYKVVDADATEDASATKKVYTISADKIIAIPSLEDYPISKRAEFQSDEVVLAIYPETSVFYHARVVQGPKKLKAKHYILIFNDDNDEKRKVDAKYVVPLPERYHSQVNLVEDE